MSKQRSTAIPIIDSTGGMSNHKVDELAPSSKSRTRLFWTCMTIGIVVAHIIWSTRLQWDIHRGLGTSAYDVGLYDQGTWLLSRLKAPFVTLMGRNLFGDHTSFVMLLVVPLYWIIPGTETLLAVQSIVVAGGALPIYFFARRLLRNDFFGFALAAVWLMNPAVNGTILENFHPDSFLGLFLPLALYALFARRWRLYVVAVILCASVKEDVSLVLVPLGVLVMFRGEKKKGAITIVAAVTASLVGMFLVMKSLIGVPTRNGWRIPFGGIGGFIREALTNPTNVLSYLSKEGRPFYLWQMTAPFMFVFALAPEVAFVSFFVLSANIVSTFWYQFHIGYHYSLVAVPGLIFATVYGLARLKGRLQVVAVAGVLICTFVASQAWTYLPYSDREVPHWAADYPTAVAARAIITQVPPHVAISVYHSLTPHLGHRNEIYMFPNPFRVVLYGPDTTLDGSRNVAADDIEYVVLPLTLDEQAQKDWRKEASHFEVFTQNKSWVIYRRIKPN